MQRLIFSLGLALFAVMTSAAAHASMASLRFVDMQQASSGALVVDTRTRVACVQRSLAGARCLPATDLLGPHGELPSFADIFWALGTAGIDGSETVLVTGDQPVMRDFVAGLLYICGQARVEILNASLASVLRAGLHRAGQGQPRGILRQRIYHASMRDQLLVLPGELSQPAYRKLQLIPVDAGRYRATTPSFSELRRESRHTASGFARYLIYARQPRLALALFARLQASRPEQNSQIRVVPVAAEGLRASRGQALMQPAMVLSPTFIAIVTRGERPWT